MASNVFKLIIEEIGIIETIRQLISFACVGVVGTTLQYLILFSLVIIARVDPVIASVCGSVVGPIVNYFLNYHWTFRSNKRHREAMTKFLTIAFSGILLNAGIMLLLASICSIYYIAAQITSTVTILFWNFTLNKIWTFRSVPN